MAIQTIDLFVNDFDNTLEQWSETGAEPWLSAVGDGKYISEITLNDEHKYFLFADSLLTDIIKSVKLQLYCRILAASSSNYVRVYLDNGITEQYIGDILPETTWKWKEVSVISFLDTWAKINACKMRLVKYRYGSSEDVTLPVNGFDSSWLAWTEVGTSPYLDIADDPTNIIYTATAGAVEGGFSFADISNWDGSNVWVYVRCKQASGGDDQIKVEIYDGSTWTNVGTITPYTLYNTQSLNVSSVLNTEAKINAAKVRFTYVKVGTKAAQITIDYCYLFTKKTPSDVTIEVDAAKITVEYYENSVQNCYDPSANSDEQPLYDPWDNPTGAYHEGGGEAYSDVYGERQRYHNFNFPNISELYKAVIKTDSRRVDNGCDMYKLEYWKQSLSAWVEIAIHTAPLTEQTFEDIFAITKEDLSNNNFKVRLTSGQAGCLTGDCEVMLWEEDINKRIQLKDNPERITVDVLYQAFLNHVFNRKLIGWNHTYKNCQGASVDNITIYENRQCYYLKFKEYDGTKLKDIKASATHVIHDVFKGEIEVGSMVVGDIICGLAWNDNTNDYKLVPYVLIEKTDIGLQTVYKIDTTPVRYFAHFLLQTAIKW